MVDVPLSIRLIGMQPGGLVTVRSNIADGIWTAEASFEVGADGVIDLKQQAPVSGSYSTVDAMGLIWSAALQASQDSFVALNNLVPFAITFEAESGGNVLASARVI